MIHNTSIIQHRDRSIPILVVVKTILNMLFLPLTILVSSNVVVFNHALAPPISSSTFVVKSFPTARTSILMAQRKPFDTRRMKALNNRSDGGGINYHNVVMMLRGGTSDSDGESDDEYYSSTTNE